MFGFTNESCFILVPTLQDNLVPLFKGETEEDFNYVGQIV